MTQITDFLDRHQIKYDQATPHEVIVTPCPKCGSSKPKFYLNKETGLYDCKICGDRGNFFKFKSLYGIVDEISGLDETTNKENFEPLSWDILEKEKEDFWNNERAIDYLADRGFDERTMEFFHIGYKIDSQGEWISIPHIEDNQLWNIKYRRFSNGDKTFRRVQGQPTILYNIDNTDINAKAVYVTESETDTMAAHQLGITNVVSLTGGAQTFKPEWNTFFGKFEKVYLLLDSDAEGQKGARKLAEKIGLGKCYNVIFPTKDVNEFMMEHSPDEMKKLLNSAKQFELKDVSTLKDVVERWDSWFSSEDGSIKGVPTGYSQIDHFTGGFKKGEVIVLSGNSGIGKTTFVNNMVDNVLRDGHRVLGFYLEGQIEYMIARMVGQYYGLEYTEINQDEERYERIKLETSELPLYWYSGSQGDLTIDKVKEFITAVVDLYGIELIVIDNLQEIVRGVNNVAALYQEAMLTLKNLAVDTKVPILLIVHPGKLERGRHIVTMYDSKNSSSIYQEASSYWILQRKDEDRWLSLDKNRMGQDNIDIPFDIDMKIGSFRQRDNITEQVINGEKPESDEEDLEEDF